MARKLTRKAPMRYSLILLAALALPAQADSIARQGADWVRLTALPCADEAVKAQIALAGEDPADYRAASAELGGHAYTACWKPMMAQRVVYLRYGDGDQGLLPFDDLKPVRDT